MSQSVKIGIWQTHWIDIVSINLLQRKVIKVLLMFKELWVVLLTVTFWPGHCLGQGKMPFGNSFVWIVSILMRIQKNYQNVPYG